jgi:hypothetical protein
LAAAPWIQVWMRRVGWIFLGTASGLAASILMSEKMKFYYLHNAQDDSKKILLMDSATLCRELSRKSSPNFYLELLMVEVLLALASVYHLNQENLCKLRNKK